MIEPKNIDRLFQEKLKDFEVHPPEHLWGVIENKMDRKKKRTLLPFWYKIAGVAALFILGIGGYIYQTSIVPGIEIPLVDTETLKSTDTSTISDSKISLDSEIKTLENSFVVQDHGVKGDPKDDQNKTLIEKEIQLTTRENSSEKTAINSSVVSAIAENVVKTNSNKNNISEEVQPFYKKDEKIYTFINEPINFPTKIDSTEVALPTEILKTNALEELLREKETSVTSVENLKEKWSVHPSIAPLIMQASASGSPLDAQFADNAKAFETTMSVGLGVTYALTNKLSVRSGINKLALGYNTYDVMIYANFNGNQQMQNINHSAQGATMMVASKASVMSFTDQSSYGKNDGYLNHRMGYLEMPLEASYKLVDKKFGVSLIGGLSTMVLTDNTITVHSDDFSGNLGSANNLNNVHFTSNLGIGVQYQFLKSFQLNFEPTFKYQFNTFSNDSGGFKPYFIGLYSGVSYRF